MKTGFESPTNVAKERRPSDRLKRLLTPFSGAQNDGDRSAARGWSWVPPACDRHLSLFAIHAGLLAWRLPGIDDGRLGEQVV